MGQTEKIISQQPTSNGLIEVCQQGDYRWLKIDSVEQSRINIEHPELLASPVYNAFLASLLFIDVPTKVLLAGVGGGAFARYLFHMRPDIQGDAVELDAEVADMAKRYFGFPAAQWDLTIGDIRQWHGGDYDLIMADIGEDELTPTWLTEKIMLTQFRQQLSADGVLAINLLVEDAQSLGNKLAAIRDVFDRRSLCLSVPRHNNIIVFAFKSLPQYRVAARLRSRAELLTEQWGVAFPQMLQQIQSDNPQGGGVLDI